MIEEHTVAEKRRSKVPRSTHLSGMTPEEMAAFVGIKGFQARQIFKWIHGKQVFEFDRMSDLSKELRQTLSADRRRALRRRSNQAADRPFGGE